MQWNKTWISSSLNKICTAVHSILGNFFFFFFLVSHHKSPLKSGGSYRGKVGLRIPRNLRKVYLKNVKAVEGKGKS